MEVGERQREEDKEERRREGGGEEETPKEEKQKCNGIKDTSKTQFLLISLFILLYQNNEAVNPVHCSTIG